MANICVDLKPKGSQILNQSSKSSWSGKKLGVLNFHWAFSLIISLNKRKIDKTATLCDQNMYSHWLSREGFSEGQGDGIGGGRGGARGRGRGRGSVCLSSPRLASQGESYMGVVGGRLRYNTQQKEWYFPFQTLNTVNNNKTNQNFTRFNWTLVTKRNR
jgi:hypothetical protein